MCSAHANNLVLVPPGALAEGVPGSKRLVMMMMIMMLMMMMMMMVVFADRVLRLRRLTWTWRSMPRASSTASLLRKRAGRWVRVVRGCGCDLCDVALGQVGMEQKEFDRLQFWEYLNLMEVLAGGDASNGVPMAAQSIVGPDLQWCSENV